MTAATPGGAYIPSSSRCWRNEQMSSVMRAEPAPVEDVGLELALLCDALDILRRGAFLFAVCEEGPLRERLMRHVREHLTVEGRAWIEVELSPDQPDLAGQLEQRLASPARTGLKEPVQGQAGYPAPPVHGGAAKNSDSVLPTAELVRDRPCPPIVFVHTRELADAGMRVAHLSEDHSLRVRVEQIRRALRTLNFQRERLSRLNVPLVFWLSQNALGQMMQHAADIFAARSGLFLFETPVRAPYAREPMRAEAMVSLLDRFHRTFLPPDELQRRASLYERRLARERAAEEPNWPRIAFLCRDLANIYRELDDYERAGEFQDEAIEAYREALGARGQEAGGRGQEWAALQVWLGLAYYDRIRGERA
nr:tetratricopeptide repeat protein [Anaerolineae bacterium]